MHLVFIFNHSALEYTEFNKDETWILLNIITWWQKCKDSTVNWYHEYFRHTRCTKARKQEKIQDTNKEVLQYIMAQYEIWYIEQDFEEKVE